MSQSRLWPLCVACLRAVPRALFRTLWQFCRILMILAVAIGPVPPPPPPPEPQRIEASARSSAEDNDDEPP